ncbi:MAG: hypothetical protein LLF28_03370 [Nitrospiraceae bacterium]|nr:hypothetical protein [Nitrospiraceae bacterium]
MTSNNFIIKTVDAKLTDIQNALKQADIKVKSIIEIYKEEEKSDETK